MKTTDRKNAFEQDNKQSGAPQNSESAAPQKSKRNDAADVVESDFDSIDPADSKPLKVEIDCVNPPTEEQLRRIREIISRDYNAGEIELTIKRVPSVVGGFNIFVGDDNYDWTTLGRIRQLRKSFQSLKKEYDTSKIISLLREDISGFRLDHGHQQVGFALSVGDGIAVIDGLHDVTYGEIVHGPGHPHGRNNRRCSVWKRQRNHRRHTRRSHTPHCRHSDKQPHPRKNDKPARADHRRRG